MGAVIILTGISMLGVWDFFSHDVIGKSVQTLGLLAVISLVVMAAGRFLDRKPDDMLASAVPDPAFKAIRQLILIILIVAVSILALIGILSIWDIITDKQILYKSLVSVGILAFSSFIIVLTCLDRENNPLLHKKTSNSPGPVLAILLVVGLLFLFGSAFW